MLTRGNVDGITSAALVLARHPDARVSFVTNAATAVQMMRRDITSERFLVVDLGLTPELAKTMGRKTAAGAEAVLLDHHEQTLAYADLLSADVDRLVEPGISAAAVTQYWMGEGHLPHLVAMADVVEYCHSAVLDAVAAEVGLERVEAEGRMLDFSWRLAVSDDRFRLAAARRLAQGLWPSEIGEVKRRYLEMVNQGRWERALERVRSRVEVHGPVAILRFGRRKPSLFGFGSRALAAVAAEMGCRVAILVHRRDSVASISARILPENIPATGTKRREFNLGRFFDEFTQEYGIAGGGHPQAAGGKIPSRHLGQFLREIECFA